MSASNSEFDVIVIGAGFCGSIIGLRARELGLSFRIVDPTSRYPDAFRAEKLEVDQSEMLEALGVINHVHPKNTPPITQVHTFSGTRETVNVRSKHQGLAYADTVNSMRKSLLESDSIIKARVEDFEESAEECKVVVRDDKGPRELRCRYLVVASGMDRNIRRRLRYEQTADSELISTTIGFVIESLQDSGFKYGAFNFRPPTFVHGLHYVTFFPIGARMRANLFTSWSPADTPVRNMKSETETELARWFPDMTNIIGPFRVSAEAESYSTKYYRHAPPAGTRIAVVGDAFQSVNPANGVGLSKCLTDVTVLTELLSNAASSDVDLSNYYSDPRKLSVDAEGLKRWRWAMESATSTSISTRLRRLRINVSSRARNLLRKLR